TLYAPTLISPPVPVLVPHPRPLRSGYLPPVDTRCSSTRCRSESKPAVPHWCPPPALRPCRSVLPKCAPFRPSPGHPAGYPPRGPKGDAASCRTPPFAPPLPVPPSGCTPSDWRNFPPQRPILHRPKAPVGAATPSLRPPPPPVGERLSKTRVPRTAPNQSRTSPPAHPQ